jgi:copper homeostasis protein CutC
MCINGHFVAVELKRPDGKGRVSDIQKAQIERILRAGGTAVVVDSFEKFKEVVNDCR